MNSFCKGVVFGAVGYVGLKCAEAVASNIVDAIGTIITAKSEFFVYDGQKERGIEGECECGQPAIGFEIPSEEIEYEEEEPEDKMRVGFRG